jgi:TonB family protein
MKIRVALALIAANLLLPMALARPTASPQQAEVERLSALVVKLYQERKYDEALAPARRAVEVAEKSLGPEHQLVGMALSNLAAVQTARGEAKETISLYARALSIAEKSFGSESDQLVPVLNSYALTHSALGHFRQAEGLLSRMVRIQEKLRGPGHSDVAQSLVTLARVQMLGYEADRAIASYQRAIAIFEKAPGVPRREVGELLAQCSCAFELKRRGEEASDMRDRAWQLINGVTLDKSGRPEVEGPKALSRVQPHYPPEAKADRTSGKVIVRIETDESGAVTDARVLCGGGSHLNQASIQAALQWRFAPAMKAGRPIKDVGFLTFTFHLQ